MEWKDQYKHPLWQKKRLEAMEDAEFVCQRCFDGDSTLHVHHRQYFKGRKIWEYEKNELEVLCEPCHEEAHAEIDHLKEIMAAIPTSCIGEITGLIRGFASMSTGPIVEAKISKDDWLGEFSFFCGQVAGASLNSLSIDEMTSLSSQIQNLMFSSGRVDLLVSDKKAKFEAFMSGEESGDANG